MALLLRLDQAKLKYLLQCLKVTKYLRTVDSWVTYIYQEAVQREKKIPAGLKPSGSKLPIQCVFCVLISFLGFCSKKIVLNALFQRVFEVEHRYRVEIRICRM